MYVTNSKFWRNSGGYGGAIAIDGASTQDWPCPTPDGCFKDIGSVRQTH